MYPDDRMNGRTLRQGEQQSSMQGCDARTVFGRCAFPAAMVYTPQQSFENLYDKEKALAAGTIFRELDLPFLGKSVAKGGNI